MLLMLCAHEPTMDPRIRWEAEFAAARFDVTVLGFNRDDESGPPHEQIGGYRIVRLRRRDASVAHYFWRFKDLGPGAAKAAAVVAAVLLLPILLGLEIASRAMVRLIRLARRALGDDRSGGRSRRLRDVVRFARARAMPRLGYILAVIRVQFAPAAVQFWDYLAAMPAKPRIVHCNDLDTLLVGALAKKHFGARLVYDAHEYYPLSDPHGNWLDIWFFALIERFLIRRADAAVTVNPMLAGIMREAYRLPQVYSVPNAEPWVAPERRRPRRSADSEIGRLAAGRVRFLFQGRFTPGRGLDELIDGWASVDRSKAALFLRGPDNLWRQAAIERAERLGLFGRSIFFVDAVTEDELVAAAAEADVGVIPYRPLIVNDRFCCPNKLSQYLHAGLMILANDLPYVKTVIVEAEAGMVYNSADLATLGAAVARIVDEPETLRRYRANALRYARERFNWQAHAATLLALYAGDLPPRRAAADVGRSAAPSLAAPVGDAVE